MSTRGYIAYRDNDQIVWNYLHGDNYVLNGTGEQLIRKYNDADFAWKLVSIGDRSYLEKEEPYNDQDEVVHKCSIEDWKDVLASGWDIEYVYLWEDGEWKVSHGGNAPFYPLESVYVAILAHHYNLDGGDIQSILESDFFGD